MGAWFGTIHIKTEDPAAVHAALEQVAAAMNAKFLVAPAINGWVSVFPHQNGADEKVSTALAAALPAMEMIHVVLADDDVFAYGYFRGGVLVDEYVSKPGYFDASVSAATRDKQRGRPEHFANLIAPPNVLGDVQAVLADREGDARRQFERFAELLRLPNAATAYEYLIDGETDQIEAFERFVRVPDPTVDRQAQREREKSIGAEIKSLQEAGVLLLDEGRKKSAGAMFPPTPVICEAPDSGFFVTWPEVRSTNDGKRFPLLRYAPPWRVGGEEVEIDLDLSVQQLALSPSGRYLAVGGAAGQWEGKLCDLQTGRFAVVGQPRAVTAVHFDPHERRLMLCSQQQLTIVSIRSGEAEQRLTIPHGAAGVAHHPSENVLLVVDGLGQLLIVDPLKGEIIRRLLVGGPSPYMFGIGDQGAERLGAPHFTPDGRFLLCAANTGVRVYEWSAVTSAERDMPPPLYAASPEPVTFDVAGIPQTMAATYEVVFDAARNRALFCGLEGRIRALDLASGDVADVFAIPGRPPTYRLVISRDGSAVACLQQPGMFERTPNTPRRLQVWKL
jgi:hypothetical protein